MAASISPQIGTEICAEGTCAHTDCALSHELAHTVCPHCGHEIGYGEPYYRVGHGYGHARCVERHIDAQLKHD